MISLSLGHLVFGYASGLVVVLLLLWLRREFFRARREGRRKPRALRCALCGTLYENPTPEPLPACPQCGQRNERLSPSVI